MSAVLERVLRATGFVLDGSGDVPGLRRRASNADPALENAFSARAGISADVVYVTDDGPKLVVKEARPDDDDATLHERAWNLGLAPLLWIVTPDEVRVLDAFSGLGPSAEPKRTRAFDVDVAAELQSLDELCGRFSLDTGAFWSSTLGDGVGRSGRVDQVLLEEVRSLEDALVAVAKPTAAQTALARTRSQELVMCTLFASFLKERGINPPEGVPTDVADALASRGSAHALFDWLHGTFNGDVFPKDLCENCLDGQLALLRDFALGTSVTPRERGQTRLFRFCFETIPIEFISSVYEAFARRAAGDMAKTLGLHYTPTELVHMALDPVFEGLPADASLLDPTCGSGIFLVQALRRLAWRRCGDGPRPRSVVRKILYEQVHGIDVEPAALRVAAFSLCLAAVELETEAAPGEETRFEHLIGRTLHHADFLSDHGRGLAKAIAPSAVVGNPPWTHGALKGTNGAGSNGDDGARRAPDQRFLSQAIDIVGRDGRLAMYVKASPFLSRAPEAASFRKRVIQSLSRVALLNLAPLRHEGLFADAKSPGLLVCANCGSLPDDTSMLVGTFPWTPDFSRSGALALSSADVQVVTKAQALATGSIVKAAMIGTHRDVRLIERIEGRFRPLSELIAEAGVTFGQGFQVKGEKTKPIPEWMASLPALFPKDYQPVSTDALDLPDLRRRGFEQLLFPRQRDLYAAPLLLFPKSAHARALQHGRTSAAVSTRDVAFSHGFYGFSFAHADPRLAAILCALLNSAVAGYQLLFGAGALGLERPSILLQDLLAIRIPDLTPDDRVTKAAEAALASARRDGCRALDAFAARLFGLGAEERELAQDAVRRGRSAFLDTDPSRAADASAPSASELEGYAMGACKTVNAVLRMAGEERRLVARTATPEPPGPDPLDRFTFVEFDMRPGSVPASDWVTSLGPVRIDKLVREQLVRSPTPYLRERRSLRIYGRDGLVVIKPAQRRYWTVASGMEDGDAILADHRMQAAAA